MATISAYSRILLAASAAFTGAASRLDAQVELMEWFHSGRDYSQLPDLDGDGFPEVLIGDPFWPHPSIIATGRVYALSSLTDTPLYEYRGTVHNGFFGLQTTIIGDMTGDGFPDFATTSITDGSYLFDGRDGTVIEHFSFTVASFTELGDVNGDGLDDFIVAGGAANLMLGGSYDVLYSVSDPGAFYGETSTAIPDVTGDGITDFAIGAPRGAVGVVYVYSGADGALLHDLRPKYTSNPEGSDLFGLGLSAPGDLTGDGYTDLVIGSAGHLPGSAPTRIYYFDGATGEEFDVMIAPPDHRQLGHEIEGVGDLNGNGYADFLTWEREFIPNVLNVPYIRVFDGHNRDVLFEIYDGQLAITPFGRGLDWNGDGFPDIISNQRNRRAILYSGAPEGVTTIGSPCPPGKGPRIGVTGSPRVGGDLLLHLSEVAPGDVGFLAFGQEQRLPLSNLQRGLFSRGRCQFLVQSDSTFLARADQVRPGQGAATVAYSIPDDPSLEGATLYAQWLVLADSEQSEGLETTRVLRLEVLAADL